MKSIFKSAFILFGLLALTSCSKDVDAPKPGDPDLKSIVILYDNDVHCKIDNYPKMAGLRDAILDADTAYVAVVSCGDFLQGGPIGALSKGQYVIDVMKTVNYDAVTLGNHEFDYGVPSLMDLMSQLSPEIVTCCNFYDVTMTNRIFTPYILKKMGDKTVAFVGYTTPGTIKSESYSFFDEEGHLLYELCEDKCIAIIQQAADEARQKGADYVFLLSHVGESPSIDTFISTPYIVANTTGIDAVLDGHTHSTITSSFYPNKDGKMICVTQTGEDMNNIGKMVINSAGNITPELLACKDIPYSNKDVEEAVNSVYEKYKVKANEVMFTNELDLPFKDENGETPAYLQQIPLGELLANAFRYAGNSQIGMINGGGIRASMPKGDVTYADIYNIMPFGNDIQTVRATGQQVLDGMEMSYSVYPEANGCFLQVAGLRYEFDATHTPTLTVDPETLVLQVEGERRITKCEVEKLDGTFEEIDPEAYYTITSNTYVFLRTNTIMVLAAAEMVNPDAGKEVDALIKYISEVYNGHIK